MMFKIKQDLNQYIPTIDAILEVTALELLNPNRVRKLLQEVIYVNFATDIDKLYPLIEERIQIRKNKEILIKQQTTKGKIESDNDIEKEQEISNAGDTTMENNELEMAMESNETNLIDNIKSYKDNFKDVIKQDEIIASRLHLITIRDKQYNKKLRLKKERKRKSKVNNPINKTYKFSSKLSLFMGIEIGSMTQVLKYVATYLKENDIQVKVDKNISRIPRFNCDDNLKYVFGEIHSFNEIVSSIYKNNLIIFPKNVKNEDIKREDENHNHNNENENENENKN